MSKQFSTEIWDYVVFTVFLIGSTVYPLWMDIAGRNGKSTKANYVFAAGRVSILPMMLSIARGTLGVRAFLGYPSELFYRGAGMWETLYGLVTAYPIVCFIFVPVYCNLGITSVYQYLDLRFKSKTVRRLASMSFIIRNCLSLGITVYTPCVALNTIYSVPYWVSLTAMSILSILFTLLGGLKAAITADVIQGLTIIFVCICVIFQGSYETGGVDKVYEINKNNGRLDFFNLTGDITTRVDTLSAWLGQFFISLSILGCQQNLVQRYLSMNSIKEVRRTLVANIPFTSILFSLTWLVGMAIYSCYSKCDPLEAGYTKKYDSILPFFVNDKLSYIPGFMGLFLATLFNGALCMNVSNINSLATVTWEDFLSTLMRFEGVEDKQQLTFIKYLAFIYAVIIMGIAFCVGFLSGVIESAMLTSSATTGPLVGAFLLAMLVPIANGKGTFVGMISSHICTLILICGSYMITRNPDVTLPTSIEGCTNTTFSPWISKLDSSWILRNSLVEIDWSKNQTHSAIIPPPIHTASLTNTIFGMSYMYYAFLGTFITVTVGIIVSYFTASDEDTYDETLLHPCVVKLRHWYNRRSSTQSGSDDVVQHTTSNINHAFEMSDDVTSGDKIKQIQHQHIIISSSDNKNESKINDTFPVEKYTQITTS